MLSSFCQTKKLTSGLQYYGQPSFCCYLCPSRLLLLQSLCYTLVTDIEMWTFMVSLICPILSLSSLSLSLHTHTHTQACTHTHKRTHTHKCTYRRLAAGCADPSQRCGAGRGWIVWREQRKRDDEERVITSSTLMVGVTIQSMITLTFSVHNCTHGSDRHSVCKKVGCGKKVTIILKEFTLKQMYALNLVLRGSHYISQLNYHPTTPLPPAESTPFLPHSPIPSFFLFQHTLSQETCAGEERRMVYQGWLVGVHYLEQSTMVWQPYYWSCSK